MNLKLKFRNYKEMAHFSNLYSGDCIFTLRLGNEFAVL